MIDNREPELTPIYVCAETAIQTDPESGMREVDEIYYMYAAIDDIQFNSLHQLYIFLTNR